MVIPLRVERSNARVETSVPDPQAGPWRRAAVTIRTRAGLQSAALPELHVMKENRSNWRVVGGAYVLPNTLPANHTHLAGYTRTVSLHRVSARFVSLVQSPGDDPGPQHWQCCELP